MTKIDFLNNLTLPRLRRNLLMLLLVSDDDYNSKDVKIRFVLKVKSLKNI